MQNLVAFQVAQIRSGTVYAPHGEGAQVLVGARAAADAMKGMGMPEVMIDWFMSLNQVVKQGWAAQTTDDVLRLTGHPPRTLEDFVTENAAAWA